MIAVKILKLDAATGKWKVQERKNLMSNTELRRFRDSLKGTDRRVEVETIKPTRPTPRPAFKKIPSTWAEVAQWYRDNGFPEAADNISQISREWRSAAMIGIYLRTYSDTGMMTAKPVFDFVAERAAASVVQTEAA